MRITCWFVGRCQKVPRFNFQSQFSSSKIIGILLNFFFIEQYQFRSTFFVFNIFWWHQFLNHFITKMMPIWVFWVCWFLGKYLFNLVHAFSRTYTNEKSTYHLSTHIFTYLHKHKKNPNNTFICNYTLIRDLRVPEGWAKEFCVVENWACN